MSEGCQVYSGEHKGVKFTGFACNPGTLEDFLIQQCQEENENREWPTHKCLNCEQVFYDDGEIENCPECGEDLGL